MASWSLPERGGSPRVAAVPPPLSESDYYACPGPCKRPRWAKTPGYCWNCGQRLVPVKS